MRKYDRYKQIEWLGDIPEHWIVKRVKDLGFLQNGVSNGKDYFGFGFPFVSYSNIYNDTIELKKITGLANSSKKDQMVYSVLQGDVFFTRTSETIDEIGISATCLETIPHATFSGFVIRLRPNKKLIQKEFSKYFFKAHINRQYLSKQISLVTRASLSQNLLNMLPVLIPTLTEQIVISQYLNTKTKAIDHNIDVLIQKTKCYKELRKNIINDAVNTGLDKNVKLQESGIDWVGKIPKHWVIKRVKDSYSLFTGNSISDKGLFEDKTSSVDYVSTKDIDVESGKIEYDNGVYIPKSDKSFKIAKAYSTLICIEGANAGKKIGFTNKDVCFVNKLCSIKSFNKQNFDKYFYYFTQSPIFEKQFFSILNGLIGGVSLSSIKYFDIISPPVEEQIAIADYLDSKTSTIDAIIANITKQIEGLKELRKTLINDVVIGKLKVTE